MERKTESDHWYRELDDSYKNPENLMTKKMNIVVEFVKGHKKLLDVGSGSGELIMRLAEQLDKVVGVEINKNAYSLLKQNTEKFNNTEVLDELKKVKEVDFDICTTLDVLEHIEDPAETVQDIFSKLGKGGMYIVTVPNWYDYFYAKVLKKNPYHITFHTRYGWAKILRKAGFNIELKRSVEWPILKSEFLAKKFPFWGMCLVFICRK